MDSPLYQKLKNARNLFVTNLKKMATERTYALLPPNVVQNITSQMLRVAQEGLCELHHTLGPLEKTGYPPAENQWSAEGVDEAIRYLFGHEFTGSFALVEDQVDQSGCAWYVLEITIRWSY